MVVKILKTEKMQIMFNRISWAKCLGFVVFLIIVYYLLIVVKFYSFKIRQIIFGKRKLFTGFTSPLTATYGDKILTLQAHQSQAELFPRHKNYTPPVQETNNIYQQVGELTARLKEAIAVAIDKEYVKREFILSLLSILKKYHFLKGSPFLVAINNLIASECKKYGYLHLNAEERVILWNE